MRNSAKTIVLWIVLMVTFVAIYRFFGTSSTPPTQLTWERLETAIDLDEIDRIDVEVDDGLGMGRVIFKNGERLHTGRRPLSDFSALESRGTHVTFATERSPWSSIVSGWLPVLVLFLFFLFWMRRFSGKNASDLLKYEPVATAVAQAPALRGLDDVRARLRAELERAKTGQPGARKILIVGPPGSGKTTLLKCAAFDGQLPLLACAGSEFVEIFVGVGASRIRKVFERAAAAQPCVLSIDDVDAFATTRVRPDEAGKVDERATTLLELNNRLEGIAPFPPKVVFVATTSRADLLDETLLRRFELTVTLRPDGTAAIDERARPAV